MNSFLRKVGRYGGRRALVYFFIKIVQIFRVFLYRYFFSDNTPELNKVRLSQPAQFVGKGHIILNDVVIGVWPSPGFLSKHAYFEARGKDARIEIGMRTFFNNGAVLIADRGSILIGKDCLIGPGFFVTDSDFHGLELENRTNGNYQCMDVIIGDDVFIGNDVKVLKGVTIGRGAVIGSGSIVLSSVPENTVFAGVPAKCIKHL